MATWEETIAEIERLETENETLRGQMECGHPNVCMEMVDDEDGPHFFCRWCEDTSRMVMDELDHELCIQENEVLRAEVARLTARGAAMTENNAQIQATLDARDATVMQGDWQVLDELRARIAELEAEKMATITGVEAAIQAALLLGNRR